MAPDEFKNLGFADEKQLDHQAKLKGATEHKNQDKGKELA